MEYYQLNMFTEEAPTYLSEQIITYLGNKRSLLTFIESAILEVKQELNKEKLDIVDLFSGSGVVSRFFKKHSNTLYSNDMEGYCETINKCYLANVSDINVPVISEYYEDISNQLMTKPLKKGFISEMYSPENDQNIQYGERVFYTTRNAMYIDTTRQLIEQIPEEYRPFLLGPLLYEASVHNNTSGVFKGFYKNSKTGIGQYGGDGRNALQRILADITLKMPIFSNFECDVHVYRRDSNELVKELPEVDLIYIDPPYNQHPYGSNYFMLNLINEYKRPVEVSKVSGIPVSWNKSNYNKKQLAAKCMWDLCSNIHAKYILISFSSDGFISKEEMIDMLSKLGEVRVFDKEYNTFRGCRNLNDRSIHIKEYLYLVKMKGD